jgi:hypothetical protein
LPEQLHQLRILVVFPRPAQQRSSAGSLARHEDCPAHRRCVRLRGGIRCRQTFAARKRARDRNAASA